MFVRTIIIGASCIASATLALAQQETHPGADSAKVESIVKQTFSKAPPKSTIAPSTSAATT